MTGADFIEEVIRIVRSHEEISRVLEEFREILLREKNSRKNPQGLVRLDGGRYYAVGDLHGDFNTFAEILNEYNLLRHLDERGYVVFLGDYVDRGYRQVEVFIGLSLLKIYYRDHVIILRGNHEGPEHLLPYPHDFPQILLYRYGSSEGSKIYSLSREIFDLMPYAAYREGSILFVHGGIPVFTTDECPRDISCILDADDPYSRTLEEILWNDPLRGEEELEYTINPRGAGYLWGVGITRRFLEKTRLKAIVRGHEPAWNGYMLDHDGRVLTLFSRLGDPYYNSSAAIAYLGNIDQFNRFIDEMIIQIS
ncbi:MAG: metallophosphoesterase family protein [Sulfolobales archaeon]